MTAVEWQFEQLFNSFEKFNNREYSFNEYLKSNLEIREQAKEMEKQKLIEMHDKGFDSVKQLNDDYAIEFAEWLTYIENYERERFFKHTTKELLEQFKKEKGL